MNVQEAFYDVSFENRYIRAKGEEFQNFFEKLMSLAFPNDFMACRPWGNRGDQKNDGYLQSTQRLFQVYAPYEMTESKAIKKIREDFSGAKKHWKGHFRLWTFVHNAYDGLPPHVERIILDLKNENSDITLETWGLEELRNVFRKISLDDKQLWFGNAPTSETKMQLGFKDIQVVLEKIAAKPASFCRTIKDVPKGKIEANALSDSIALLLKEGMTKVPIVEDFFTQWYDIAFGERIAESFRQKYGELREQCTPNQIFCELQSWIGGKERKTPEQELAILTVMAYYFERCDIFEEPREAT